MKPYTACARREFALGRGAIRCIVGKRLNCHNDRLLFVCGDHGKIIIEVKQILVSLELDMSHGEPHELFALADGLVAGIGVEMRQVRHGFGRSQK